MDNRGLSPVVEKTLTVGLVLLFVGGFTTTLLGGTVPNYRTTAGEEVSERVLSSAAHEIEAAPPATDGRVERERHTALPATIRDAGYALVLENRTLRLDHPTERLEHSTELALPPNVTTVDSRWNSGDRLVVSVTGPPENRTVRIGEGA